MHTITTIGLDIAKSIFQVHGVDAAGQVIIRRQLKRRYVLTFFQKLSPCLVGIEACGSAHHWSRELQALGHTVRSMPPAYSSAYFAAMRNLVAEGGIADWGWSDLPLARSPSRPSRKSGLVEQRSCLSGDEAEAAAEIQDRVAAEQVPIRPTPHRRPQTWANLPLSDQWLRPVVYRSGPRGGNGAAIKDGQQGKQGESPQVK